MPTIIEHRKSTVAEGRSVLISIVGTLTGMGLFLWFFPILDMWFYIAFSTIVGIVAILGICYSVVNIRANSTFVCRIDNEKITCVSPVKLCGESFSLSLKSIAKVERVIDDTTYRWYLWNREGQRFQLTSNYDNPVETFIDAIRERCPDLIELESSNGRIRNAMK